MRKKVSKKVSNAIFRKNATRVKKINIAPKVYRGGIRL